MRILLLVTLFYINYALQGSRICSNCKHFFVEKSNENTLEARCLYFKKQMDESEEAAKRKEIIYLVTGKNVQQIVNKRDLFFCCTARTFENMCGRQGKKYESKNFFGL